MSEEEEIEEGTAGKLVPDDKVAASKKATGLKSKERDESVNNPASKKQDDELGIEKGDSSDAVEKQKTLEDEDASGTGNATDRGNKICFWTAILLTVVIALVIGLGVGLSGRQDVTSTPPPIAVDYSTGVSLVTFYGVDTVVRSRLARTTVSMEVANALDCSSIHSITLQLPRNARVTSLKTITDTCTTNGEVQKLEDAREAFLEAAQEGLPSAYIEEQDSSTHGVQVAIPPLGTTRVELVLEELLQQRLGKIEFQVPLAPNEDIDQIVFDLKVQDITPEPVEFHLTNLANEIIEQGIVVFENEERMLQVINSTNATGVVDEEELQQTFNSTNTTSANSTDTLFLSRFHLDIPDAREYDLPKVLRGWYNPSEIEESGMLVTDGTCFEHFFLPSSAEPMPRNLVFLVDTSTREHILDSVKEALIRFIDTLTPNDQVSIQTYGRIGTLDLWGPSGVSSDDEKADVRSFIDSIYLDHSYDVDLQEAFLEALLRAKRDAEKSSGDTVTVLVAVSAKRASTGELNRAKIATNIYKLNQEGHVKVYTLGFPQYADMQLLDAISLMNGGVTSPILSGEVNYTSQIFNFLDNELGSILLSDVEVSVTGNGKIFGETQHEFPLLAYGSEVIVRGLVELDDPSSSGDLQAHTSAATTGGMQDWTVSSVQDFYSVTDANDKVSLCFQSYAHDRITQLLRLRDAAEFMESNIVSQLVDLADENCDTKEKLPECLEAEALDLAIRGNVVVRGLTAMVTVDDNECLRVDEDAEVCLDGTTPDSVHESFDEEGFGSSGDSAALSSATAAPYKAGYEQDDYDRPAGASAKASSESSSPSLPLMVQSFISMFVILLICVV